mmetsp:Transcript_7746/g.10984  ORF Transcript_7746/g.10984 Transcript_7746/m.10984 type:complete len:134 (-) Transcript_7746:280-681(-)
MSNSGCGSWKRGTMRMESELASRLVQQKGKRHEWLRGWCSRRVDVDSVAYATNTVVQHRRRGYYGQKSGRNPRGFRDGNAGWLDKTSMALQWENGGNTTETRSTAGEVILINTWKRDFSGSKRGMLLGDKTTT